MASKKPQVPRVDYTPTTDARAEIFGNEIEYFNYDEGLFYKTKAAILRAIKPINPFAVDHTSTEDHIGFGTKDQGFYFNPETYPNSVVFSRLFAAHYDPVNSGFQAKSNLIHFAYSPHYANYRIVKKSTPLPRACQRYLDYFKRCKMINGSEKCSDEVRDVMEICPSFALEQLKEGKRKHKKIAKIQADQYREAMKVSSYNTGRTMANVSNKTYVHGTRKYLRPDTLWADERYVDVSQAEVDAAKVRYAERLKREGKTIKTPLEHVHTHPDADYAYNGVENRHIYAQPLGGKH